MASTEPQSSESRSVPYKEASDFPGVSPTGDAFVDEALRLLTSVSGSDGPAQHAAYERLHDELLAQLNTEHG